MWRGYVFGFVGLWLASCAMPTNQPDVPMSDTQADRVDVSAVDVQSPDVQGLDAPNPDVQSPDVQAFDVSQDLLSPDTSGEDVQRSDLVDAPPPDTRVCVDSDGDRYGRGPDCAGFDCNDALAEVHPGAPELCNGRDDDCNGSTDESVVEVGMPCVNAGLQGECRRGFYLCNPVAPVGLVCTGRTPLPESCNGLDDDCNGATDDSILQVGLSCTAPGFQGICQFGSYSCPSTAPFGLQCSHPQPGTVAETCNGRDDDCNGTIDDPSLLNNRPCGSGFPGICSAGLSQCAGGNSICTPTILPGSRNEICNGLDDNCDGLPDNTDATVTCRAQNPSAAFVSAWNCSAGGCGVGTCEVSHADVNGTAADGCECATDSNANNCFTAGTVTVNYRGTVVLTGVVENSTASDWVTVNFVDVPPPMSYHPRISLSDSAGRRYGLEVYSDCVTPVTCQLGSASSVESVGCFEQNVDGSSPTPFCCSSTSPTHVTSVKVRVVLLGAPACQRYQVTILNS